jgi:hypothetical protein
MRLYLGPRGSTAFAIDWRKGLCARVKQESRDLLSYRCSEGSDERKQHVHCDGYAILLVVVDNTAT